MFQLLEMALERVANTVGKEKMLVTSILYVFFSELADNNFKLDGNGGKLSKKVEKTLKKSCYKLFLPFP